MSLPFRKLAVFTIAMSGAPPERSDAISIQGRVPILAARHDQASFLVASRGDGFLVLDASGQPQMIGICLLGPVWPRTGFTIGTMDQCSATIPGMFEITSSKSTRQTATGTRGVVEQWRP
jgi:hypothetical protein